VKWRPGTVTPAQERAYRDADVKLIVDTVVANPQLALVKLARLAILFRVTPDKRTVAGLIGQVGLAAGVSAAAQTIAEAGLRIAGDVDRDRRNRKRGAVLERLTHELVLTRDGSAAREQEIFLTGRRWSKASPGRPGDWTNPKDVVLSAKDGVFEVYECKLSAFLDQDDLDELGDIGETASSEGTAYASILATLESEASLFLRLRLLQPRRDLYVAAEGDMLELAGERPQTVA
jgi:hypothetical protein